MEIAYLRSHFVILLMQLSSTGATRKVVGCDGTETWMISFQYAFGMISAKENTFDRIKWMFDHKPKLKY